MLDFGRVNVAVLVGCLRVYLKLNKRLSKRLTNWASTTWTLQNAQGHLDQVLPIPNE